MKSFAKLSVIILFIITLIFQSCKKEEVPTLTTANISNFTVSRASCGGEIKSEGTGTVIERGVCWSTDINPTISDNRTIDGAGAGSFTSRITGLMGGTKYYVRAYATNSTGTGYGMAMSLTTLVSNVPTSGLVGYFPFDGDSKDKTTNGNNGSVSGATLTIDRVGDSNCAYYFDGFTNMITGSTANWPLSNSNRTLSVWFKLSSLPANGENNILLKYGPELEKAMNILYIQYTQANGKKVIYDGYFDGISVNYNFEINLWYNVVGTYDGTNAKLYINGELKAQGVKSGWNTVSTGFHIGGWYNPISFIHGSLDDIRIYNRALNSNEIISLYNEIP